MIGWSSGILAVQHAQRIGLRSPLAIVAHLVLHRLQRLAQRLVVARTIFGAADGVQLQPPVAQAEFIEQRRQHLQHLGIAQRRLATRTLAARAISAPICQNWRYRPFCGRSRRNCGPM